MVYTMDDASNMTLGSYADLLTDEYGGMEIYGEDWKIISELLETDKPEEIIFATDEDCEIEDYEKFRSLVEELQTLTPIKEIDREGGHALYDYKGVRCVLHCNQMYVITIKGIDREVFNKLTF